MPVFNLTATVDMLKWIFLPFPHYALGSSLFNMNQAKIAGEVCRVQCERLQRTFVDFEFGFNLVIHFQRDIVKYMVSIGAFLSSHANLIRIETLLEEIRNYVSLIPTDIIPQELRNYVNLTHIDTLLQVSRDYSSLIPIEIIPQAIKYYTNLTNADNILEEMRNNVNLTDVDTILQEMSNYTGLIHIDPIINGTDLILRVKWNQTIQMGCDPNKICSEYFVCIGNYAVPCVAHLKKSKCYVLTLIQISIFMHGMNLEWAVT